MVLPTAVGLRADREARALVRALSVSQRGCDTSYLVWKPHGLIRMPAEWCDAGAPPLFVILHGNPRGFLISRYGMEPGTDPLSLFNRLVTLCVSPTALADFLARDPAVGSALRKNPARPIVIISCSTGGLGELATDSSGRQLARRLGHLGFTNSSGDLPGTGVARLATRPSFGGRSVASSVVEGLRACIRNPGIR